MNPTDSPTVPHLRTYEEIFSHPTSHNIAWRDVRNLFDRLGEVEDEPNGKVKLTRNGHSLVLNHARAGEIAGTEEVMALRHFLTRSESPSTPLDDQEKHWLLVIDHHQARLFRSEIKDGAPQQILPHPPADFFRHAHNSKDFSRGQEKPDPNSFFAPVAHALRDAGQVLIFGTGTGTSSEMEQFVAWVKIHHPDLGKRVIGTVTVDENHLTEGQLLAKAREYYGRTRTSNR